MTRMRLLQAGDFTIGVGALRLPKERQKKQLLGSVLDHSSPMA